MTRRSLVLFVILLAVALIATLPLRLALAGAGTGLGARAAEGSIWSGRLIDARLGPLPLGQLSASVSPLALLIGRIKVSLAGDGSSREPVRAILIAGGGVRAVEALSGSIDATGVLGPLPISSLAFVDAHTRFEGGACRAAGGQVRATIAPATVPGLAMPPSLSGTLRCEGAALILPLASVSGAERLTLRLTGNGRWTARASIGTQAAPLSFSGDLGAP